MTPATPGSPASRSPRALAWAVWLLLSLGAVAVIVTTNWVRAQRVEFVSRLTEWSVDDPMVDASSPTGYAGGTRRYIAPNHNNESYQWIAQTQQMLARGEWRVRRVDYENAPTGREVHAASPYRWWLGFLAWLNHLSTGRPIGQAVESAAVFADPLLHLLLLLSVTGFVAWQFGPIAATLISFGLAGLFPFAGGFSTGVPSQAPLMQACALWSLLPLLAGMKALQGNPSGRTEQNPYSALVARRWFVVGGVMGGCGLWLSVRHELPILLAIALGGAVAALFSRRDANQLATAQVPTQPPWRAWALSGAAVSLLAYLVEYFPNHLHLRLEVNHPLYALAWAGTGELLVQIIRRLQRPNRKWSMREKIAFILPLPAIVLLPIVLRKVGLPLFPSVELSESRLSLLNGLTASNLSAWITRDGWSGVVWVTLLPMLLGAAGLVLLFRPANRSWQGSIALAGSSVVVAALLGCRHLEWWNAVDGCLLALLPPVVAAISSPLYSRTVRGIFYGTAAVLLLSGLPQLWPQRIPADAALSDSEGESYIERDLAHWLAQQAGPAGALVLAPPSMTTGLCFHGGLRGLSTMNWENDQGTTAAVRMVSASSIEEASALLTARGVTHIVLPSWDSTLDEYAALGLRAGVGSERFDQSFIGTLHRWELPPWLRPIPYPLPPTAGVDRSIVILEVVEEQDPPLALSRLAEYFIEMQQLDRAVSVESALRHFPGDLSALTALASLETARGDTAAATATFSKLLPFVSRAGRRPMAFDRRLSLAILLAQQKQSDLAKEQVTRCLAEVDEAKLRSLTTVSLYRLELLGKLYGLHLTDPALEGLARSLLRPDLRARL